MWIEDQEENIHVAAVLIDILSQPQTIIFKPLNDINKQNDSRQAWWQEL